MNEIQKYVPMVKILLKDDRVLYTPEHNHENLLQAIENKKFVTIEGVTINVYEIKTIEKATITDYDLTKSLNFIQKEQFKDRVKEFKKNLNRTPTREEKIKFINKIIESN